MMFWSIWKKRNEKLWEGVVKPCALSIQSAIDLLHQLEQAKERQSNIGVATVVNNTITVCWETPSSGSFKCNVDAAIFEDDNKFGVGICVHDDQVIF